MPAQCPPEDPIPHTTTPAHPSSPPTLTGEFLGSVPPTLRAGSIKMKQDRSPAEHLLPWYPGSAGALSSLARPTLTLSGGMYGQKRQEAPLHSREHAYSPPACRRH